MPLIILPPGSSYGLTPMNKAKKSKSEKSKDVIAIIGKMTAREIQVRFPDLYVIANSESKYGGKDRVEITVRDRAKAGNRELKVILSKESKDKDMDYSVKLAFPFMPKDLLKGARWWLRDKKLNIADPKSLIELEEWLTQNVQFLMTLPPNRSKSKSGST